MKITRILTDIERENLIDWCRANGYYANDRRIFTGGMAWYAPWYYDPSGEREKSGEHVMYKVGEQGGFLSPHYWRDWAAIRPPICVVCPNGEWWEIDRKSSNGDGWAVTGDLPNITCTPSIVVPGYHGFLQNGEFTADLEGRGETGHEVRV